MKVLVNSLSDGFGGVESLFYNIIKCNKFKDMEFDFTCPVSKCAREDDFLQTGAKIFLLPRPSKKLFDYIRKFQSVLKNTDYSIYHVNLTRYCFPLDIIMAKMHGVKVVIHCHATQIYDFGSKKNRVVRLIEQVVFKPVYTVCTDLRIACSENAGRYLFGNSQFCVLYNGIDLYSYRYNEDARKAIRKELNLEEKKVIGHVGRMSYEKNHFFLLDIIKSLIEQDESYRLLLVGDGDLYVTLIDKVKEMGLEKVVIFTGQRSDVGNILSAMDAFILPSLHEALPIVLIEAQANGLPCVVSDTITHEIDVTDLITRVSLRDEYSKWVETISAVKGHRRTTRDQLQVFDIESTKEQLLDMYNKILRED